MKAEIDFKTLYNSEVLLDFFFRNQAKDTLEELMKASDNSQEEILNAIGNQTEEWSIDDVEELFYSETVPEIIEDLQLLYEGIEFPYLED
jgi:hypothetical protein